MVKKTVTFKDFDGNSVQEDCYFHLYTAEVVKWLMTDKGCTLDKVLEQMIKERKGSQVMDFYDDLLRRSYGVRDLDGIHFIKNDEVWNRFKSSEAYSIIYMELVTDQKKAADFLNAIIPKEMADEVEKIMSENRKVGEASA